MSTETTNAGKQGDWQQLAAKVAANREELGHLEVSRVKLEDLLRQAQGFSEKQASLIASKQEVSQQLKAVMTEGDRMATLLRQSVKAHFGIRSEKLAEFGVQPFRGRTRKAKPPAEVEGGIEAKPVTQPTR
jgi:hypothetical protein